ncbi:hypothetical protein E4U54_003559 [Claviceps lovelessii]|nr:hypothetical protein E4U54_003559 [Claviceps lovelessii]
MKAAILALVASAAVVSANPGGEVGIEVPFNCAKANANYCVNGDIILRCDGNKVGVRGRCSDNVSGYPPVGGLASCYQSSPDAGDAACEKNCVVYADKQFTLPADKCTPSNVAPSSTSTPSTATATGTGPVPTSTPAPTKPVPEHPFPIHNSTTTLPHSRAAHLTSSSLHHKNATTTRSHSGTATTEPTTTSADKSSSTGPSSTPTGAANVNQAAGLMAAAGFIVALFL